MKRNAKEWIWRIAFGLAFLGLLASELCRSLMVERLSDGETVYMILSRASGALVGLLLMLRLSYGACLKHPWRTPWRAYLVSLPCWLVVINNFPWLGVLRGDIVLTATPAELTLYVLLCVCVACFEEILFRGAIFLMVLEHRRKSTWQIFWSLILSSAIFGAVHMVNLLMGAGLMATLLQIGYSFLIGGMCSVMLIYTRNMYLCIALHAVYNFGGGFVPAVADGTLWDTPTVVITAVLGVLVAAYVIGAVFKIRREHTDALYPKKEKAEKTQEEIPC